ncbi:hypothetical protein [Saccharothrix obliqua]|uniref:hypothetical protein n=1 Tax=Saccharothrix obliqua TaxID=2861747 RepID=UPI001C603CF0|nr:hypothetical protein [Saccharothrix obliqua]MBW4717594.1 hypothetical protein [Saccharothrix obliqua]
MSAHRPRGLLRAAALLAVGASPLLVGAASAAEAPLDIAENQLGKTSNVDVDVTKTITGAVPGKALPSPANLVPVNLPVLGTPVPLTAPPAAPGAVTPGAVTPGPVTPGSSATGAVTPGSVTPASAPVASAPRLPSAAQARDLPVKGDITAPGVSKPVGPVPPLKSATLPGLADQAKPAVPLPPLG